MKKILQQTLFAATLLLMVASCKKEETKIYFEGGNSPVLTADRSAITLSSQNKTGQALALYWTNPNYTFTTGVSSQDVSYLIQFDTVGANFTSPTIQGISVSKNLSYTMTVSELNTLLTKLGLESDIPHNIEIRVVASIGGTVSRISSVLTFNDVVPYEDFAVEPPSTGQLFIIGSATPGGWGNPVPANQEMTALKKGLFQITVQLSAGNSYLFIPKNGDWSHKYGGLGANNTNNPLGDAFKPEGGDLLAPGTAGNYQVTVDFKTGKFSLTKL